MIRPPTMLPRMVGIRLKFNQVAIPKSAPRIIPSGNRNMFTTVCSNTSAKKMKIGNHIIATRPDTERAVMLPITPRHTIRLQKIPRTKQVIHPSMPMFSKPRLRAVDTATNFLATALSSREKLPVSETATR